MLSVNQFATYNRGHFEVRVPEGIVGGGSWKNEQVNYLTLRGDNFSFLPKKVTFTTKEIVTKEGNTVLDLVNIAGLNVVGGRSTLSLPSSRLSLFQVCEVLANWDGKSFITFEGYKFTNDSGEQKDGIGGSVNGERIAKDEKLPFGYAEMNKEVLVNFFKSLGFEVEEGKPKTKTEPKSEPVKQTAHSRVEPSDNDLPF